MKSKSNSVWESSLNFILCIASYKPLNKYNWSSQIINQSNLNEVIKRQIQEPNLEKN